MSVNLLSLAQQYLGGGVMDQIGKAIGADPQQTRAAVTGAVPAILAGLANKASTPGGADALAAAVDQTDSGMLDGLGSLLGGGGAGGLMQKGTQLGSSLLGGGMLNGIVDALTRSTGMSKGALGSLIGMLMPIVLGILGKQKKAMGLDASGLAGMLSSQKGMLQGLLPQGLGGILDMGGDAARAAGSAVTGAAGAAMSGMSHAAGAAGHAAQSGGSMIGRILPLIVIAAVAYFAYTYFMKGDTTRTATQPAPSALNSAAESLKKAIDPALTSAATALPQTLESLVSTLGGITDEASAKAAVKPIEAAYSSIVQVADGLKLLPESAQKTARDAVSGMMPKIQEMVDKVLKMEGIGDMLKSQLDALITRLKKLVN